MILKPGHFSWICETLFWMLRIDGLVTVFYKKRSRGESRSFKMK